MVTLSQQDNHRFGDTEMPRALSEWRRGGPLSPPRWRLWNWTPLTITTILRQGSAVAVALSPTKVRLCNRSTRGGTVALRTCFGNGQQLLARIILTFHCVGHAHILVMCGLRHEGSIVPPGVVGSAGLSHSMRA